MCMCVCLSVYQQLHAADYTLSAFWLKEGGVMDDVADRGPEYGEETRRRNK